MLQSWRNRLPAAIKKVGKLRYQGYTDCSSTLWTVMFETNKFKDADSLEDWLRDKLNFTGWLVVKKS